MNVGKTKRIEREPVKYPAIYPYCAD